MKLFRMIKLAFSGPVPRSARPAPSRDRIREIVAAHSHGNIRLQAGRYFTKGDVDAKFEEYRSVRFADQS